MRGLDPTTRTGKLSIGAASSAPAAHISMHTKAWCVLDCTELCGGFEEYRGENVTIPGAAGKVARKKRRDEKTFVLPMVLSGQHSMTGIENQDVVAGLLTNQILLTSYLAPPASPNTTRSASLLLPTGVTRLAEVQCALEFVKRGADYMLVMLLLTVPAGRFV